MKLYEAVLRAARQVDDVYEGTSTSGSPTYIVDTKMNQPEGHYTKGALVISSGSMAGTVASINQHIGTKFTFDSIGTAPEDGSAFTAITKNFTANQIIAAIHEALATIEVPKIDTTHSVTDGECTLVDVSNVRRVFVDAASNHTWSEVDGMLKFADGATGDLEIWYMAHPSKPSGYSSDIDPAIDDEWLMWATVTNLYRKHVQVLRKDNPTLIDMLNEAKNNEAIARQNAIRRQLRSMKYQPRYGVLK